MDSGFTVFMAKIRCVQFGVVILIADPATTPVAVIYKATWPESQTVRGTLADIGDKVRDWLSGQVAL
jgi:precorrin-4 methylase